MAYDPKATTGIPMNPAGMNDNTPLETEPNWYQTRGVHSLSEKCLQRCNGKLLLQKFPSPVLGIHGSLRNVIYVETSTALYIFDSLLDSFPDLLFGDDEELLLGDDDLPMIV